jgi:hypothetical protein
MMLIGKFLLTEGFAEILFALDPHPPVRGIWVYHGMIDLDTFAIGLLVSCKVFQSLPRASPW